MKRDQWLLCLTGAVLSFVLSLGTVKCIATAFSLEHGFGVAAACLLFAVGSALCLQLKSGGISALLLCAVAFFLGNYGLTSFALVDMTFLVCFLPMLVLILLWFVVGHVL